MTYVTDGVHLYEVVQRVTNYGLIGGEYLGIRDASRPVDPDEDERLIMASPLEVQLFTPIQAAA